MEINKGEDELYQIMKIKMNTEEEQIFMISHYLYLEYGNDNTKFVIDFNNVWKNIEFSLKGNAKRALDYANKNGWGSCGTPVGKLRSNQLSKGEPISVDTIKRMYSFLSRHEGDLETSTAYGDGCGKLMYDAWGGKAALGWSRNKLRQLGLLTETEAQPSITSSYPGQKASGSIAPALK